MPGGRRIGRGGGRRRGGATGPLRLSRFIEPAILYLLGRGQTYGYDLVTRANELGLSEGAIDPGAVYRTLRELEMGGCVVSSWDTSGGGPARHVYTLTAAGRERLGGWVEILEHQAAMMTEFVKECHKLLGS